MQPAVHLQVKVVHANYKFYIKIQISTKIVIAHRTDSKIDVQSRTVGCKIIQHPSILVFVTTCTIGSSSLAFI